MQCLLPQHSWRALSHAAAAAFCSAISLARLHENGVAHAHTPSIVTYAHPFRQRGACSPLPAVWRVPKSSSNVFKPPGALALFGPTYQKGCAGALGQTQS